MESREISLGDFQSKLGSLRYGDYYCIITEIQDDLALPEETTLEEMESLLIKATKDCFNDTIEGDIALMALGLMKGFYHHEAHGKAKKEFPIKKRRIKFLNESSYLGEEYEGLYASYGDVEKAGSKAVKQVFDRLGKTEDRCINKIATKIYNKSEIRLKKYMPAHKIDLPECKSASLSHDRTAHNNHTKTVDHANNAELMIDAGDMVQSEEHTYRTEDIVARADGGTFVRKHDNVTIQVNINNAGFVSGHGTMGQNLPPVEHIFILEKEIRLKPEENYILKTAILPKEAYGSPLRYISSNTDIATISAEGIITSKDKCGMTDITIEAESGCTSRVMVIVEVQEPKSNIKQKSTKTNLPGWGPKRPTYTMENPAGHATFNSITNNPVLGDERDFVRIVEVNSGNAFTNMLEIEPDKQYAVYIYYHNNASEIYNNKEHRYVGVARDVRVISYYPDKIKSGEFKQIDGIITASNTEPKTVWGNACITTKKDLIIKYVEGTARIYNQWDVNGAVLPTELFSRQGAFIGLKELNGVILGGSKYSGQIIYRIQTYPIKNT